MLYVFNNCFNFTKTVANMVMDGGYSYDVVLEREHKLANSNTNKRYTKGSGLQTRDSNIERIAASEGRKISPIATVVPLKRRYQYTTPDNSAL